MYFWILFAPTRLSLSFFLLAHWMPYSTNVKEHLSDIPAKLTIPIMLTHTCQTNHTYNAHTYLSYSLYLSYSHIPIMLTHTYHTHYTTLLMHTSFKIFHRRRIKASVFVQKINRFTLERPSLFVPLNRSLQIKISSHFLPIHLQKMMFYFASLLGTKIMHEKSIKS